jgi:beta-mannosidase
VGGYRRPLEDARRAGVRFASECLGFANVPDEAGVEAIGAAVVHDPRWKAGVPRDVGPGWDFDDTRDHYLALLFGVDPVALRSVDPERYLELSRAVTGEVMAEVFGEWRRAASPCGGGLILWLRDLVAGAGWGVVDRSGMPKPVYHHLRRALAPIAVWTTDEGLGGIVAHVANDGPAPLAATLRVALYRDGEQRVEQAGEPLELAPHTTIARDVEELLGRFADVSWAYRFGPPGHDAVVVSLERDDGELVSQAFRFPAGRPLALEPAERLGLEASAARPAPDGAVELTVRTRRLAHGVRIHARGFDASDDAFSIEPGGERRILLRPRSDAPEIADVAVTALNLHGRARAAMDRT